MNRKKNVILIKNSVLSLTKKKGIYRRREKKLLTSKLGLFCSILLSLTKTKGIYRRREKKNF